MSVNFLGVHLSLLVGPGVPLPAPLKLLEALDSVEVTTSDEGRSGFQLSFKTGRSGLADIVDDPLVLLPQLAPFSRVILTVIFQVTPVVLIDGIITNRQFAPSADAGGTTLTITGEDVSVMMDMEEKVAEHPAQPDPVIVAQLLLRYAQYGLIPEIVPPLVLDVPIPIERIPVQTETDLQYIQKLAERHGHVFFVRAGPAPLVNRAYWGPPPRMGIPQRALSVNMGAESNVRSISFQHNGLAATLVSGRVVDRRTLQEFPVESFSSLRLPPLAAMPALPTQLPNVRRTVMKEAGGLSFEQALAKAQADTDKSTDAVVSASGELDALRYGGVLEPRGTVGVRGVGYAHDGIYYVKSVTHKLRHGDYTQSFNLTRDGLGAITPVVRP